MRNTYKFSVLKYTIHKEGRLILAVIALIILLQNICCFAFLGTVWGIVFFIPTFAVLLVFVNFYRYCPNHTVLEDEFDIVAPADGTVTAIEPTLDDELTMEERLQLSIRMSMFDAHSTWTPFDGKVITSQHRSGRYKSAYLPKSSKENEHTNIILESDCSGAQVLMKQIAGAVARRVVNYATPGKELKVNDQIGFIRFGSRTDLLFPLDSVDVKVRIGDHVKGGRTVIARFRRPASL